MFTPSPEIIQLLRAFAPCFTAPTFAKVVELVCGVILSPGRRTVASALSVVGRRKLKNFCNYHRVLSRDRWSAVHLSQILLSLLLKTLIEPDQVIDIVGDETLERRRGKKIAYKGWFRDAVRSTHSVVVTTLGIRWLCLCVLVCVPWCRRRWALPFFTIPVCSEKTCLKRNRAFRGSAGLTVDALIKVRQWLGYDRMIRFIGDGGFATMELILFNLSLGITQVGRLNIAAKLYDAPGEQPAGKRGPKPKKGARQASLKSRAVDPKTKWETLDLAWYGGKTKKVQVATDTALWHVDGYDPASLRWVLVRSVDEDGKPGTDVASFFSTDLTMTAEQIVLLYSERWNIEVFFEEVRACLGFETQRGWTNRTIGRTTPCLFGIFSLIVLLAVQLFPDQLPVRQAAWYIKEEATFRDVLAAVREHLWLRGIGATGGQNNNTASPSKHDRFLISGQLLNTLREVACYAT